MDGPEGAFCNCNSPDSDALTVEDLEKRRPQELLWPSSTASRLSPKASPQRDAIGEISDFSAMRNKERTSLSRVIARAVRPVAIRTPSPCHCEERSDVGRKGAPPVAESSDRSGWAGTCLCTNEVQGKGLVPTRVLQVCNCSA